MLNLRFRNIKSTTAIAQKIRTRVQMYELRNEKYNHYTSLFNLLLEMYALIQTQYTHKARELFIIALLAMERFMPKT